MPLMTDTVHWSRHLLLEVAVAGCSSFAVEAHHKGAALEREDVAVVGRIEAVQECWAEDQPVGLQELQLMSNRVEGSRIAGGCRTDCWKVRNLGMELA